MKVIWNFLKVIYVFENYFFILLIYFFYLVYFILSDENVYFFLIRIN